MTRARSLRSALAACAASVLLAGCKAPDVTPPAHDIPVAWENPHPPRRPVRRVIVPPFEDRSGDPIAAETARRAMLDALARKGSLDCVAVGAEELREELPSSVFATGSVPRKALVSAARRFHADGVLFGSLKRYHAYEPMVVGLTLELVASDDGGSRWSVDATFDASVRDVEEDARNFHDTVLAEPRSLEGWRTTLSAPSRFLAYACARIAAKTP
jgi:hypothetical protein